MLIGDSVFMGKRSGRKGTPFRIEEHPELIIIRRLWWQDDRFVVDANLGPMYASE